MNKITNRIQKLLSLSNSVNEEEAQLAFTKAKELADKYGLDLELAAIVNNEKAEKSPMVREMVADRKLPVIHKYIITIMEEFFKVKVVYNRNWSRTTRLNFIGRQNDVEVAKEVYDRLLKVFDYLWKKYQKENGLNVYARNSYLFGLKNGLTTKLYTQEQETKKNAISELPSTIQTNCQAKLELALIDEKQALANAMCKFYPRLGRGKATRFANVRRGNIYEDGVKAGQTINAGGAKQHALTQG